MRAHVIKETQRYAKSQNDSTFTMTDSDLRYYVGTMFLSGYHSLTQQQMYWERNNDVETPIVSKFISKNRFTLIKKYIHLANNEDLNKNDKFAKVRPLYDIANKSLHKFGF